jgi:hypothetical protein
VVTGAQQYGAPVHNDVKGDIMSWGSESRDSAKGFGDAMEDALDALRDGADALNGNSEKETSDGDK